MDQVKIGAFLRQLRLERGMTQGELAERFGVTNRSVSRWETGANMPDLSLLIEIADFYEVELRELLDGERHTRAEAVPDETETIRKVADYTSGEKSCMAKIMARYNLAAVALFTVGIVLHALGLDQRTPFDLIAGFCNGAAYGTMIMTALYITGRLERFRTWKMRFLKGLSGDGERWRAVRAALSFIAAVCFALAYLFGNRTGGITLVLAAFWACMGAVEASKLVK